MLSEERIAQIRRRHGELHCDQLAQANWGIEDVAELLADRAELQQHLAQAQAEVERLRKLAGHALDDLECFDCHSILCELNNSAIVPSKRKCTCGLWKRMAGYRKALEQKALGANHEQPQSEPAPNAP